MFITEFFSSFEQPQALIITFGAIGLFNVIGLTIALVEELRGNSLDLTGDFKD